MDAAMFRLVAALLLSEALKSGAHLELEQCTSGGHVQKPAHTAEAHAEVVQPLSELRGFSKHQCSRRASTMGKDGTSRKGTVQNYAN
ncbi:hypothetical protein Anapl_14873 [Anas platyrhynchos]|uniref:Secreted protein n=1 Tax=Anas platyrhynchos TaxID=8839 RepID=R0LPE0_ANAPL|nr:hypothetical protein Anapl_14873 [Anas platyrhynchos]